MFRDLGIALLVLATLIVVAAHGGCGGNDIVFPGTGLIPSVLPSGGSCKANGASCAAPADCCSQLCQAALCACLSKGATCTFPNTCCSGNCIATPGITQMTCK
jgi:hypothetical protein